MRVNFNPLIKSCCTWTVPAAKTKSIGQPADAPVSWFLLFHLDNFIVTRQLSSIYRDLVSSRQLHRDQQVHVPLPGLAKTTPPRRRRQLNYTAGPLGLRVFRHYPDIQRTKARVWLTPNTCFSSLRTT
jgi:hypothetical protein